MLLLHYDVNLDLGYTKTLSDFKASLTLFTQLSTRQD